MEIIISFLLGALSSWLVTHIYYRKYKADALVDAKKNTIAQRLDWADWSHKLLIVAIINNKEPIPLYSYINWSGKFKDGETKSIGSNGCIMFNSLRIHNITMTHIIGSDYQNAKFGLNERGIECAEYLKNYEVEYASFDPIDSSNAQSLFSHYGYPPSQSYKK